MSLKNFLNNNSFTLIEIVVFIAIIIVLYVSVLSIYAKSLFTSVYNENKTIASHYAEELSEWFLFQRDVSFEYFEFLDGTYCFNSNDLSVYTVGPCSSFSLGEGKKASTFKREAIFKPNLSDNPYTDIKISVYWKILIIHSSVTLNKRLSKKI